MRHWNTGDHATDMNLQALERMRHCTQHTDAKSVVDLVITLINVSEMMPERVRQHFNFPNLYSGSSAYHWCAERRASFLRQVSEAITDGLARAEADSSLTKGGGADLSDRPQSLGEVILKALKAYSNTRSKANLDNLKMAVESTHLRPWVHRLEMLSKRSYPIGDETPEAAFMNDVIMLEIEASRMHFIKA